MTDAEPTSVQEQERADGSYLISRFVDGSVRVSRVEKATVASAGSIMARGITGCSVSGTSNRAQMNLQATQCATLFTTNFELRLTVSGGKATVSWA